MDEYNEDVIGQSFYLEPNALLGQFTRAFFVPAMAEFVRRRSEANRVDRR